MFYQQNHKSIRPSGQSATQTIIPIGGYAPLPPASQLYYPRGATFHAAAGDTLWWLFVGPHGRWEFAASNGASTVSGLRRALQARYWDKNNTRLPSGRELGQLYDPTMPTVDRPMLLRMAYALRESMRAGEGYFFATEAMANILESDAVNGRISNDTALLLILMQYHMNGSQTVFPLARGAGQRFYVRALSDGSSWKPAFNTPVLPSASWEFRPIVAELDQLPLSGIAAIDSKRFEQVAANGTRTAPQVVQPSTPAAAATPPAQSQVQTTTIVTGTAADWPTRIVDADSTTAPTTSSTPGAFTQQQPPPKWGTVEILAGGGGKPDEGTATGGTGSTGGGSTGSTTTGGGTGSTGGGTGSTTGGTAGVNAGNLATSVVGLSLTPMMVAILVVIAIGAVGVVIYASREPKGATP